MVGIFRGGEVDRESRPFSRPLNSCLGCQELASNLSQREADIRPQHQTQTTDIINMASTKPQLPQVAIPGQPLLPEADVLPGTGTYASNGTVHASILGVPVLSASKPPILSIQSHGTSAAPHLPTVGDSVYARITKVSKMDARCEILVEGASSQTAEGWGGVLRKQDLREREVDKAEVLKSVRVGDVIRAKVISLGDQSNYFLSTAGNSLGVVVARAGMSS